MRDVTGEGSTAGHREGMRGDREVIGSRSGGDQTVVDRL